MRTALCALYVLCGHDERLYWSTDQFKLREGPYRRFQIHTGLKVVHGKNDGRDQAKRSLEEDVALLHSSSDGHVRRTMRAGKGHDEVQHAELGAFDLLEPITRHLRECLQDGRLV